MLALSLRKLDQLVAYALGYEFEDVLRSAGPTELRTPGDNRQLERSRKLYKTARMLRCPRQVARTLAPMRERVPLNRDYELFVFNAHNPWALYALETIPDWRERCAHAVCYLNEAWVSRLPTNYLMEMLNRFDHVFIGLQNPVEPLSRQLTTPVSYLPLGCDVLRFAPADIDRPRSVDLCNIGRRATSTHRALLTAMRTRPSWFYYFDTAQASGTGRSFRVDEPAEHRLLLAQLLRNSRYYIANRARINESATTHDAQEISARFYEGAAAGTVMIGVPPDNPSFREQFDWPDAVIPAPYEHPGIVEQLDELDRDPERLRAIRVSNVRESALRHDWLYRLKQIYSAVGLPPSRSMVNREARLQELADRLS